jgi:hypothetical protein
MQMRQFTAKDVSKGLLRRGRTIPKLLFHTMHRAEENTKNNCQGGLTKGEKLVSLQMVQRLWRASGLFRGITVGSKEVFPRQE